MSLKSVIIGIGIGAIAGILLAPKKGSEMREDLKAAAEKGKNLSKEDVKKVIEDAYNAIIKSVDDFDAAEIKGSTKAKLDDLKDSVDELASKAKDNENVNEIIARVKKIADDASVKVKAYKEQFLAGDVDASDKIDEVIDEGKEEIDKIVEEIEDEDE